MEKLLKVNFVFLFGWKIVIFKLFGLGLYKSGCF